MLFKKKAPEPVQKSVSAVKKKKISLDIYYLQSGKVYSSCYSYDLETDDVGAMDENSKKIVETLQLIVSNIYEQLNDKSTDYVYVEEQSFILNKRDFLNCNITTQTID